MTEPAGAPRAEAISSLPPARFKSSPEDFVVDELPAYEASGSGEHLMIHFRKRGLATPDAVNAIARALGVSPREAGVAGMKDKHAVTTQRATFALGRAVADAADEVAAREAALAGLRERGVEVLSSARHGNKLKPGHLVGNRFNIVLRGLRGADLALVAARLEAAGREGVPNAFGPQRFGRDGENPASALSWLTGQARPPRDAKLQRLLFSSVQSLLFNDVLRERERLGTWRAIAPGDVAKKVDSGGLFDVPLEGDELESARERALAGLVVPTGPMFGSKMRWPSGEVRALEQACLDARLAGVDLHAFRHLGEGTRRALVLAVANLEVDEIAAEPGVAPHDDSSGPGPERALRVRFTLAKGGYATTVLQRACALVDASAARRPAGGPSGARGDGAPDGSGDESDGQPDGA